MLTQDQVTQLRIQAGLSPIPQTPATTDVISQRKASLGISDTNSSQPTDPTGLGIGSSKIDMNSPAIKIAQNIWNDYKNSVTGAAKGILQGANTITQGANELSSGKPLQGIGNIARGAISGVTQGVGGAVGAVFSPLSGAVKTIPSTGNKTLDSAIQGGAAGATFGPTGAVAGAGLSLGFHAINAAQQYLLQNPKIAKFAQENPDVLPTINAGLNVILAAVGAKNAGGEGDYMNAPIQEAPGIIAKNIGDTINATGIPGAVNDVAGNIKQGVLSAKEDLNSLLGKGSSDENIISNYNKAIKPTVGGKNSPAQQEAYNQNVIQAVKSIVANKDNLNLVDEEGEPTGKLPQNPQQFVDAQQATKQNIFQQYDALQKAAGEKGAEVDLNDIADELDKFASNRVVKINNPEAASYAKQQAEMLREEGTLSTQDTQDSITARNNKLQAFYKNPNPNDVGKTAVDSLIANGMRKGLDQAIEDASEDVQDQPGYQELKNQYGSLKAIEKDILRAAQRQAKGAPAGLMDMLSNVGSGAELIRGLATMNPVDLLASGAIKGFQALNKYMNSPNRLIQNMFEGASSGTSQGPSTIPTEQNIGQEKESLNSSLPLNSENVKGASNVTGQDAVNTLLKNKSGEAIGAFEHPELGKIGIEWGQKDVNGKGGYGLAHILEGKDGNKVANSLEEIIKNSKVVDMNKSETRAFIETPDHKSVIVLNWKGKPGSWVLTSYVKK